MPGPNNEFDMPQFEADGGVYVWDSESHSYVWKPDSGLEQDRGHSTGGDNDLFNQNQLEHSELAGSPETEGFMSNGKTAGDGGFDMKLPAPWQRRPWESNCPSCRGTLNKNGECRRCGFGKVDNVSGPSDQIAWIRPNAGWSFDNFLYSVIGRGLGLNYNDLEKNNPDYFNQLHDAILRVTGGNVPFHRDTSKNSDNREAAIKYVVGELKKDPAFGHLFIPQSDLRPQFDKEYANEFTNGVVPKVQTPSVFNQLGPREYQQLPQKSIFSRFGSVTVLADYNGWTNWDTWITKLMMDNEQDTWKKSREIVENGLQNQLPEDTIEQELADWALQTIVGPHNQEAMESAREWNDIPQEERVDPFYDEFVGKNPNLQGVADLFGGPNTGDTDAQVMHDAQINWHEIYESIKDEYLEEWRHENGHEWAGEDYPDFWPQQQGGGVNQPADTGNSGLTLPPSWSNVVAGWIVTAEDWTPELADSQADDPVWQNTIPFLVFPDGRQLIGRPGQQHAEINGNNWGLKPEYQGRTIMHPQEGEVTQWPVDPQTMQEPEWLTPEQKQTVQSLVRRRYRGNQENQRVAVVLSHEWTLPSQVSCPNCQEATDSHVCPHCGKDLTPEWNTHGEVNTLPTHHDHDNTTEHHTFPDVVPKRNREKTDDSYPSMSLSHIESAWDAPLTDDQAMPEFSHFDDELAWKEANTPSLDECPECRDPMFDKDGKKVCTSCGHTQPIIYHQASPVEVTATTRVLSYKADPESTVNALFITARQAGQVVGYLVAKPYQDGFITDDVIVREDKRRQGIATQLVMKGREYGLVPYASTPNQVYRSVAGQALAAKTGGATAGLRTSKVVVSAPALLAVPEVAGLGLDALGAGAEGGALTGVAGDAMGAMGEVPGVSEIEQGASKIPGLGKLMNKALQGGAFQEGQNFVGGGGAGGQGGEQQPDYSALQGTLGSFHKDAAYTKSSIIGEIVKGIKNALQGAGAAASDFAGGASEAASGAAGAAGASVAPAAEGAAGVAGKGNWIDNTFFNPKSPVAYIDDAAAAASQGLGDIQDKLQQAQASIWDFVTADSKDTFGEDEVGWATNNRGENSDPDTASSTGIAGEKEHGDSPEQLKDVDGTGGPTDSAPADDLKNQGDPELQDKALRMIHMNLPLIIEFAGSDEPGSENPILQAIDSVMEEAFPGYKDGTDEDNGAQTEHPEQDAPSEDESGEEPDDGDSKDKKVEASLWHFATPEFNHPDMGAPDYRHSPTAHPSDSGHLEERDPEQGAYVCPNCEYSTNNNEYNCPRCGEELVDHDPLGYEPDQDEYTGVGDYEMYGPDRPTWNEQFPHEGASKEATMGGVPLAPGAVPTGADNGIGALPTQAPVCPMCGQTHAAGTACPYQNQNMPTTAPVMQGAPPTPPSPNTVVTKWNVVAYSPLEEVGGLPTCSHCGAHGTNPQFDNGKIMYTCDQCGRPFDDTQGVPVSSPQVAPIGPPQTDQIQQQQMAAKVAAHPDDEVQFDTIHQHHDDDEKSTDDVEADSTDWSDVNGDPLVEGQTYEMNSVGGPDPYAIPDKVTITTIHPHKIIYTLKAGDLPFEDELTKQQADIDGLEFNPVGDLDPYDSEDGFEDYEEPVRPGQDAIPQVDDLSTPSTVVSHEGGPLYPGACEFCGDQSQGVHKTVWGAQCPTCAGGQANQLPEMSSEPYADDHGRQAAFEPISLENYTGSYNGDAPDNRSWLMEDSSPVAVDPALMEKLAGKDYSAREQREFIDESGSARNLDRLDLRDTHYIVDDDPEIALW